MLEGLIDTLNWLSITVPFFAGAGAYIFLRETFRAPKAFAVLGFLVTLGAIWVGLFYLYPVISFPGWMRWPHEWFR